MDELTRERFMNELLKKRVIYLDGEVTQDTAKRIGASILWLNALDNRSKITIYINSSGGSVSAGLDIYDIVRHSKAPVTGIVYRMANSMATIVLQACKTRQTLRHNVMQIHNIMRNEEWHKFEENLEETLKDTKKNQQNIYEIMAERTGRTIEEIKKACREAKTMTADEAKEFGLIDEVI